jgi:hypothetical protein
MLKTRTGTSFLDSGGTPSYDAGGNYIGSSGGYGRAYERNQVRTFIEEDEASLGFYTYSHSFWKDNIRVTKTTSSIEFLINVFHFLDRNLEYDQQIDDFYNWYLDEVKEEKDDPYLTDVEDFIDWLRTQGFELGGIYGGGDDPIVSHNTYNGESNLSQVLQFSLFCVESVPEEYEGQVPQPDFYIVLLQIHQGADVRGGYTAPVGFTLKDPMSPEGMVLSSDGYIGCSDCDVYWQTNDGHYWYENGSSGGDKILDWAAYKRAQAMQQALNKHRLWLEETYAKRYQSQAMVSWMRLAQRGDRYGRMYELSMDILEAYRIGDEALAAALQKTSDLPSWMLAWTVSPSAHDVATRLIMSCAKALAHPQVMADTAEREQRVKACMDSVPKRPYLQLDLATMVEIDDIEFDEELNESLQKFLGNPTIPDPVPDEQLSFLEDDSDIRESRNHARNRQDVKGWAVANEYVLINDDHEGFCPFCGGKLIGGF